MFLVVYDNVTCCHFPYRPKNNHLHKYPPFSQKLFNGRCINYIYSCSGRQGLSKNKTCFGNLTIWSHDVILLKNKIEAMTLPIYANDPKSTHKQLHVCRTICAKFQQNRPGSFATNAFYIFGGHFEKKVQLQAVLLDRSY